MLSRVSTLLHSLLLIVFIGSLSSIVYYIKHEPSVAPAATFMPAPPMTPTSPPPVSSTAETVPDTGWSLLEPGLERRVISIYDNQNQHVESLHIWRVDQNHFQLDVAYDESPKSLTSWQAETNALIVLNGGYYSIKDESYFPDGLTIVDGKASGRGFSGYGGMLAIQQAGAELRWLVEKPYNPYESLHAALQSFPVLVKPGGVLGFGAAGENHVQARRTVIAQDTDGRILLMVAPEGYFTLHQLSVYLTGSDLNLDIAVNLDGGGSTGILVAKPPELISPTRPLPFVILVYPR